MKVVLLDMDPLERFMKHLCKGANLSRNDYTNHSIRATVITTLDNSGFEARHITAISGHKNETTIKTYSVKCPEAKKRQMNRVLQNAIGKKKVKREPSATAPNPNFATPPLPNLTVDDLNQAGITGNPHEDGNVNLPPNFELKSFDSDDEDLLEYIRQNPFGEQFPEEEVKENTPANLPKKNPGDENKTHKTTNNNTLMSRTSAMQMIPRMLFQGSNVTINYNINTK